MSDVAICILSRGGFSKPNLWKMFIENSSNINYYLHNKHPVEGWESQYSIPNIIPTGWGKISLVEATIELFKEALKNTNNSHFALVSGDSLPLQSPERIYQKISSLKSSHINCNGGFRARRYWRISDKELIKPKFFTKHGQWIILTREAAEFFTKQTYFDAFKDMVASDEHYFGTIANLHNIKYIRSKHMHAKWPASYSRHPICYKRVPSTLIKDLQKQDFLFIRKIHHNASVPRKLLIDTYNANINSI